MKAILAPGSAVLIGARYMGEHEALSGEACRSSWRGEPRGRVGFHTCCSDPSAGASHRPAGCVIDAAVWRQFLCWLAALQGKRTVHAGGWQRTATVRLNGSSWEGVITEWWQS